jgi:hypothetical protein
VAFPKGELNFTLKVPFSEKTSVTFIFISLLLQGGAYNSIVDVHGDWDGFI